MKKRVLGMVLAGALAVTALTGCSAKKESGSASILDPKDPVSLTIWHYYNGAQQAAFDELVSEFNATEGKELGIFVEGFSQGSVSDLEQAIADSVAGKVGASELPDIFSAYPDTAYAAQKQGKLTDLSRYFTQEELSNYVPSYIEEGYFNNDGALYLFPVAKSTEIMMINLTDWQVFADATGSSLDELKTLEGVVEVSKRYYEWTDAQTPETPDDGKAFYGRDSMSNYFIINMMEMGTEIFEVKDNKVTINADKEKIRRLWDDYYVPYVQGYFTSLGKFRSDDVKTGDLLAYTGSSSSSTYFPDAVMTDDETREIDFAVLTVPMMEDGSYCNVQQGASMAVTASDEKHEYAACEFLRWFTRKENNLRFVCQSAYLPVTKEANSREALDAIIEEKKIDIGRKAYECLASVLDEFETTTYYSPKCFDNGYKTRKILDYDLSDKAVADRAAISAAVAAGADRAETVAAYITDEAFEAWYSEFCAKLETTANA